MSVTVLFIKVEHTPLFGFFKQAYGITITQSIKGINDHNSNHHSNGSRVLAHSRQGGGAKA